MTERLNTKERGFLWISIVVISPLIAGLLTSFLITHRMKMHLKQTHEKSRESAAYIFVLAGLYEAASEINAPGNNIFKSKNLKVERENLEKAIANYDRIEAEVYSLTQRDSEHQQIFTREISNLNELRNLMIVESSGLFGSFEKNKISEAATRMAILDSQFAEWRRQYSRVVLMLEEIEQSRSDENAAHIRENENIEFILMLFMGFIFLVSLFFSIHWLRVVFVHEYRLRLFQKLDQFLLTAGTSPHLIADLIRLILTHLGWHFGAFWRFSKEEGLLVLQTSIVLDEKMRTFQTASEAIVFEPWIGIPGRVWASKQAHWIYDFVREKHVPRLKAAIESGLHGGFAFPIVIGEEMGVMECYSRSTEKKDLDFLSSLEEVGARIGHSLTRTKIHEELLQAKNLFEQQNFALNSSAIVAITDIQGKIIHVNDKFVEISGYQREELIGQDHRILNSGHHSKEFFRGLWKTISQGQIWRSQIKNRRKDGSYYWVDSTIVPLRDVKGKIYQFVAIRNDITEQKVGEEELLVATNKALEAARIKSEFLANTSHEIRTPMNAIIGMADLLYETSLTEEQRRYVDVFRRAGDSLLNMINDILDISKMEAGRLQLEKLDFNLRDVLEDCLEMAFPGASEKNLEIHLDYQPTLHEEYLGDIHRIRQIISNLIANAIKFTSQGSVTVSVKTNTLSRNGNILISVQDTGIGIPANKIDQLFCSFTQVDSSITRKYGGTGLGLSICKKLVELMGGEIWVESVEGRGATFLFTLALEKSARVVADSIEGILGFKDIRILVVDDREVNRVIIKNLLLLMGADVLEASSGAEGFRVVEESQKTGRPLHLVIVDDQIAGRMGGFGFIERAKSEEALKNTPIILLTLDRWPVHQSEVLMGGVFSVLYKPIRRRQLCAEILRALGTPFLSPEQEKISEALDASSIINPLRILLVDDSDDNRALFRAYLRGQNHYIIEAENGEQALEKFKSGDFDIVFMDMQMPVLDGYSATKRLRGWEAQNTKKAAVIVAFTAYAQKEERERCLAAGCNEYLAKPVRKHALMAVLLRIGGALRVAV